MKLNKCKLGDIITQRREKYSGEELPICGITREGFIPPKQKNADISLYNVFYAKDFVFNPARMELNSIVFNDVYEKALCSSLYEIFFVNKPNIVLPEFLALIVKRNWFTRYCEFLGSGSAREYCRVANISQIEIEYPDIEEQRKIVQAYKAITDRIKLKKINDNLEAALTAVFFDAFSSKETAESTKLSELISFGNGKSRPKTGGTIPVYGGNGVLSYTDKHNIENAILIGRVGAYCGSVYLEQGICWVSDNAIYAKSKISKDEFFDYFLLKGLNLFNHHVGTGQQLLTQEILNNIEVATPDIKQVEAFNEKAKSVFKTISANRNEIGRLQEFSDLLLSRLAG